MRTTNPLTDTQIRKARRRNNEYSLADGNGLFLRIKSNGYKSWLFNYARPFTRKRTNIGIGQYPAVSLTVARKAAAGFRELLARDIDPAEHRARTKQEKTEAHLNTLQAVSLMWLAIKKAEVSPAYAFKIQQGLENHVFPKMGNTPAHKISAPGTIAHLAYLDESGSTETLNKVCRWLNEIMNYAVNTGIVPHNPLTGIRKGFKRGKPGNMPAIGPEELPALLTDLVAANITLTTRCLALWQLHSMARPGEAAATRWDEIDTKGELWTIPGDRMKGRKEHVIPITAQMEEILDTMKPISGNREYVFPSAVNPRAPASSQSVNAMLKRIGYRGKLVSHGFRSLASTILNEHEFPHDVIEKALAHGDPDKIRGAYNRAKYLEQRRIMGQWWSDVIGAGGVIPPGKKGLSLAKSA